MKQLFIYIFFSLFYSSGFAQDDFIGIVKYKLSVLGSQGGNTDSMAVIFDRQRVMVILYLPDSNRVVEKVFLDDLLERKSYKIDREKSNYSVDSLKSSKAYEFINSNSIGQVNRELCIRYHADLGKVVKSYVTSAECLAAINYRKSFIKDYSFLGVQPMIVDNRVVLELLVTRSDGTKSTIAASDIRKLDNVESYFDLWEYIEVK